nr:putative ribonuclease H-like domain-containing protein [Tanacetum cinerariifolium]
GTLKGKWRYLIPAITPIHNHVLIPNYRHFKIQDFCYSDGFECFQAINIGRLHMDLFGPTFVKSLSKKSYCLVITDDYSRFSWVFFLASKDETAPVLKTFIISLENLLSLKVKVIRCDNGTEFKNSDLNQFCGLKVIKREFSVPRTPQQNGIAERKNRTLIEVARTLLVDSLLPIPF